MNNHVSTKAISIFMGVHREEAWPIELIEKWIIKNKRYFSLNSIRNDQITIRQAMTIALGCYLDISYKSAEELYYKM